MRTFEMMHGMCMLERKLFEFALFYTMNHFNKNFYTLTCLIEDYFKQRRVQKTDKSTLFVTATKLRYSVEESFPKLVATFYDVVPDLVYVERVISFAIQGLDEEGLTLIWDKHFLNGYSTKEISLILEWKPKYVEQRIEKLPLLVAIQLWEKHCELIGAQHTFLIASSTLEQRQKRLLARIFNLTPRQSDVLMMFYIYSGILTRKEIADELSITINTLKQHIKPIIKNLQVSCMSEAVDKVRSVLEDDEN